MRRIEAAQRLAELETVRSRENALRAMAETAVEKALQKVECVKEERYSDSV